LAELVEQGKLRPVIGAEFALQDIKKAHDLSESGRTVGKIVLSVGQPFKVIALKRQLPGQYDLFARLHRPWSLPDLGRLIMHEH
jgi:hypothetical protein